MHEDNNRSELAQPLPPVITLELQNIGIGGPIIYDPPAQEWIGHRVFFVALSDTHRIPTILFDLSPDGTPFYVFNESEQLRPIVIKKAAEILSITNDLVRAKNMILAVESPDGDEFMKRLFVNKMAGMAPQKQTNDLSVALRAQLLKWRDNTQFDSDFRLFVDTSLAYCFPEEYQVEKSRIKFLKELKTKDDASQLIRGNVDVILGRAEQVRQRIETDQFFKEAETNVIMHSTSPSQYEP